MYNHLIFNLNYIKYNSIYYNIMSNILIIGSCAREHSILKKLYSDNITNNNSVSLFCVGNNKNPGILEITKEIMSYLNG